MWPLSQRLAYDWRMPVHDDPTQLASPPSPWVVRFSSLVPHGGDVLDVACGTGRHARFFAAKGHRVDAVDRDLTGFVDVPTMVRALQADIEAGPWPYEGEKFPGVIVTNYLHRPLMGTLIASVAVGGTFIYETFAVGNQMYGRPSRAEFLLKPGELLEMVRGHLQVVAFEDIYIDLPKPAKMQRIAAVRAAVG